MSKATRKKAMRLKAAHAHSFTHSSGASTPTSLSIPPSPHRRHSETSSPAPTLIGPNPPEEIFSELNMLADLYQGDDQPVGETQRNIPSEYDDGYGYELVESIPHIEEYSRVPPMQWITHYRTYTFHIWML